MNDKTEMYDFLTQAIDEEYDLYRKIRDNERGTVQVIRHRSSKNLYILRRFTGSTEAYEILKKLRCPHLPLIAETAHKDGLALVMEEYIQGDSLQELLNCGTLTTLQTKDIAGQICDALWVLHHAGLVHRDVKPDNVMISGSRAVLIDFDAARVHKPENTADTLVLGTVGYAPPEQYGISQTDARADIYALGVMMNVMLTGEHPSTAMAGGKIGRIIRRCTMTSPRQRFSDISQVKALLS